MPISAIGLNISKLVIEMQGVDRSGKAALPKRLRRAQ
jgi:hypothetical protein